MHFVGQDAELGDEMPRVEVAEEGFVGLRVVVGALDEDGAQQAGDDLGRGVGPYPGSARREREAVGLDVAEDQDFFVGVLVEDEESGGVDGPGLGLRVEAAELLLLTHFTVGEGFAATVSWGEGNAGARPAAVAVGRGWAEGEILVGGDAAAGSVLLHTLAVADAPGFDG